MQLLFLPYTSHSLYFDHVIGISEEYNLRSYSLHLLLQQNVFENVPLLFAYRSMISFIPLVKTLLKYFSVFSPETHELLFTVSNITNHISIAASSQKTGYESALLRQVMLMTTARK
jgi:hypothetical protein